MVGFPGRTMAKAPTKAARYDSDRAHTDNGGAPRNQTAARPYIPAANNTHGRTYRQSSDATLGSFNTISSGNSNQPATPPTEAELATVIYEGPGEYPQNQWSRSPVEENYTSVEPPNSQWTDNDSSSLAPPGQAPNVYFSPYYTPGEHNRMSMYSGKGVPSSVSAISRRNTSECIETRMLDPESSYPVPTNSLLRRHTEVNQETIRSSGEHHQYQYKAEVDVWQDGLKDPESGKTAILNFVILQINTGCQRSNWVSKQIIERLRARTQSLSSTPEFFSFNGTTITPTNVVRLSFRSTEEGPGPAHTAMFFVAAGQVPFEMLLGQDYVYENGILPKANLRGVWVLTSNALNRDAKKKQAINATEHNDRAAKHERSRKQRQKEKEASSSRQNSGNTSSTGGSGRLVGWFSK